mgnify:CR=1 FL=1
MSVAFLVCGLLFPRLTLLWCWFMGTMPANPTDHTTDVVCAILAPRLLIAYWTTETNTSVMWTVLYCVLWLVAVLAPANQRAKPPAQPPRGRR